MLPGSQLIRRASAYQSLAVAIEAGLPLDRALSLVGDRSAVDKQRIEQAGRKLAGGGTLVATLEEAGIVPPIEARALEAAELAGKLPEFLRRLASDLEERTATRRRLAAKLAYPILLFHAAVLLPAARYLITDGVRGYLAVVAPVLGGAYALVGAVWLVTRWLRARAGGGPTPSRLLGSLPLVGRLTRGLAMAEFANLLALLLSAGIALPEAIELAAKSVGDSRIARAGWSMRDAIVRGGSDFATAIAGERGIFPTLLIEAARAGEASGKLDETLVHAAAQLQRDARARVSIAITLVAALIYLAAAAFVAYSVITAFTSIYSSM